MTKTDLNTLARRLPKGYLNKALAKLREAGHTSYYPSDISRVKNGRIANEEILAVLITLANEEDERKAVLARQMRGHNA